MNGSDTDAPLDDELEEQLQRLYADPIGEEQKLDDFATDQLLRAWGKDQRREAYPRATPAWRFPRWLAAAAAFLVVVLFVGMAAVANSERGARRRSDAARALLEAKTKDEVTVRALIMAARSRLREPRAGRVTEARKLLLDAGEPLRALGDDEVVRELEFEIRSAFADSLPLLDVLETRKTNLAADPFSLWPVAGHPDGRAMAIATTRGVVVWKRGADLAKAGELRPLVGARLQYSPDGKHLALLSPRGGLSLHDRDATRVFAELEPEGKARFLAVGFTPDGKTVHACTAEGRVRAWDIADRKKLPDRATDVKGMATLTAASFDPAGERLLIGDEAGLVRMARLDGKAAPPLAPMQGRVEALAWAADGRFAAGGRDGSVLVMDVAGVPLLTLSGLDSCESLAFSPDGRWLLGGQRGAGRIWDSESGEGLHVVEGVPVGVSRDGRSLAVTATTSVAFAELLLPAGIVRYPGHRGSFARVAWAGGRGGDRFFATLDGAFELRVWKVGHPRPLLVKRMPRPAWYAANCGLALSNDARTVAFAGAGPDACVVRVIDVATGELVGKQWELPGGYPTLVSAEGGNFLLLTEEGVKDRIPLKTVARDLAPGKPAKAARVLREAGREDVGGYYNSGVAGGLYWWIGPRHPADAGRVEVRDMATGKLVFRKGQIGMKHEVGIDAGGKALWFREGSKTVLRFDLTSPRPGVPVERVPGAISTDGRWACSVPRNLQQHELDWLVLERSGEPYLAIRGVTRPLMRADWFSPDERLLCWGYHLDGVVVIADLNAVDVAVDRFMKDLRR